MRKLVIIALSASMLLWAGSAFAWGFSGGRCGPPSYDCGDNPVMDFKDYMPVDVIIENGEQYTWNFDLDNDFLVYGDVESEDIIVDADLYVKLYGIGDSIFKLESDGYFEQKQRFTFIGRKHKFDVLAGLQNNHMLDLTIINTTWCNWDIKIDYVKLVGKYCDVPAPVPEPATMLLLGTGLVGLAGSRFRKKKK